ncbi:hypothetical protein Golob_001976 [Gossypium lobatum]|uniref:Uncharacterized protein n=1 Tax=Gossypium lobatum TaxID=34289 RepID=A0A7J8N424_9ROSI|nr:hypothetical protein [Gossypium lobatum]
MEMSVVTPVCYCRNPAKLNTSWSNDNPSMRFLGVKSLGVSFENHVIFFTWFDPPLMPHSQIVLLGLLK